MSAPPLTSAILSPDGTPTDPPAPPALRTSPEPSAAPLPTSPTSPTSPTTPSHPHPHAHAHHTHSAPHITPLQRRTSERIASHYADPTGAGLAEAVPHRPSYEDLQAEGEGEGPAGAGESGRDLEAGVVADADRSSTDVGEAGQTSAEQEQEKEKAGKLDWDGPADPDNPRNWSNGKKWASASVTSFYTFVAPLASSMMAPGLPQIAIGYQTFNPTIIALSLSVFILAFGVGPLILAPLSEMYGRRWILHVSNLFFLVFLIACAKAPDMNSFIGFRFLAGLGGSAPIAIGGGLIADLWNEKERASAMALYSLGPLVGPVLGPVAGGFIVQSIGFHWLFWILAILSGAAGVLAIFLLRETYAPVLLARRAAQRGIVHAPAAAVAGHPNKLRFLLHSLYRPWILLFTSIVCFSLSLYMALVYGFLYLLFVTFPTLYQSTYGWSPGIAGLAYLGPGIGFLGSTVVAALLMDRIYAVLSAKNGGVGKPEFRIPVALIGAVLVPIGLFWYGWSAQAEAHWILPIIGSGIFAFGMMLSFFPMQVYIIDTFEYAASALAAATVFRCLFGFAFPLFGEQMFAKLGAGGGNSLLAGLAIVIGIPFPVYIWFYGERLRAGTKQGL